MTDAPWSVGFTRLGRKDLERLDSQVRRRVYAALDRLAHDDPATQVKKLQGIEEWRIRVGDWRVRFVRDADTHTIAVQRVLPRGRAYER